MIDRVLRVFADVRRGEGRRVLVLAANLFVLMLAYYLLKTIREPLVLGERGGGAEVKSYATAGQALVLAGLVSAFGWLASRVQRMKLIAWVTGFFAANLVAFWAAFQFLPSLRMAMGVAFFVWVGCFNVMIIAQFWAFANDLHSREAGERLFALVGGGAALGAVVGAWLAKPLYNSVGAYPILLIVAALIVAALQLTWMAHTQDGPAAAKALDRRGGFQLLLRDRYLQLVAAMTLLKNFINTTGEYILDRRLVEVAHARLGSDVIAVEKFIANFKSDYFTTVNVVVMALQLLAVSRIIRYLGVRRALLIMPLVALASYSAMAMVPVLSFMFVGKVAENSTDYSLHKTVEQTLFLVTSREAKYKAKAVIDTLIVRVGDLLSAALVWTGTHLGLSTLGFIGCNAAMVGVLLFVAWRLAAAHREKSGDPLREPLARSGTSPALT